MQKTTIDVRTMIKNVKGRERERERHTKIEIDGGDREGEKENDKAERIETERVHSEGVTKDSNKFSKQ